MASTEKMRVVKVKRGNEWVVILFKDIQKGDLFRLFEPDGEKVTGKTGSTVFHASNDAEHVNGVWRIEMEELVDE